jgi:1-hydroxycarotenoid 3,4-desaturase
MMRSDRVVVIGGGVGGLTAAIDLARRGAQVTLLERAATPGGKMRQLEVDGAAIDAGPTVFTMRWIFEQLFADAGDSLERRLALAPATILARHAWASGGNLDLHADIDQSAAAIERFANAEDAQGYRDFCARSADVYRTLAPTFIAAQRPSPLELVQRVGLSRLDAMWRTAPFSTLWRSLGQHFRDPRLRQLFGRYATYCGSSPLTAPTTLMLVAHVEQDGVWQVRGGMRAVALALAELAQRQGAVLRCSAEVSSIIVEQGRTRGVVLADGERLPADAVVFNGEVSALPAGLLGSAAQRAAPATPRAARSLSAVTWCLHVATQGFDLEHHNVFFADDYPAEFHAIFRDRDIVATPTVYVCAQDRGAHGGVAAGTRERLLMLINAPPDGDRRDWSGAAAQELAERSFGLMRRCGLEVERRDGDAIMTTPAGFEQLFPGSGGALYGRASAGMLATFKRPGARSRIPGLYLAGGSVHPGPGVPMAAMSGRLAAAQLLEDLRG